METIKTGLFLEVFSLYLEEDAVQQDGENRRNQMLFENKMQRFGPRLS